MPGPIVELCFVKWHLFIVDVKEKEIDRKKVRRRRPFFIHKVLLCKPFNVLSSLGLSMCSRCRTSTCAGQPWPHGKQRFGAPDIKDRTSEVISIISWACIAAALCANKCAGKIAWWRLSLEMRIKGIGLQPTECTCSHFADLDMRLSSYAVNVWIGTWAINKRIAVPKAQLCRCNWW